MHICKQELRKKKKPKKALEAYMQAKQEKMQCAYMQARAKQEKKCKKARAKQEKKCKQDIFFV